MYRQGLRQRPLNEVLLDCMVEGHEVRPKDIRNYWNGWYRHELYFGNGKLDKNVLVQASPIRYSEYPDHPYKGQPEPLNCFVPCSKNNRPLIKWGSGTMTLADARAWPHCMYLAENMKGAQRIVIDIDGDHGGSLDLETIRFFSRYMDQTACHVKPEIVFDWFSENEGFCYTDLHTAELPVSYHLTFGVDKVIPTMHFPEAHVDIVGNKRNSLRYFKNKKYNGLPPLMMSDEIWDEIMDYIDRRKGQTR